MRRLTTPVHKFTPPIDIEEIDKFRVIYKQNDNIKLIKNKEDFIRDGEKFIVKLTQQETFSFDENEFVKIQAQILTTGDDSLISKPILKKVNEVLFEDELK